MIAPGSIAEFVAAVRASPRVNLVGAGTKPRLAIDHGTRLTTAALSGILEYDPSEYTITALAGTTLREITATLAERGQYLPFDPPLVDAGATIGGTVAAGLSGSGRFRFGGLRDFILGVRFIDGEGRLLRAGGKVVKNAAGFDLPKFFTGSLGRFGALVECTFKVFPRAPATRTLEIPCATDDELAHRLMGAANTRWEIDALDANGDDRRMFVRLAGNAAVTEPLAREVLARWPGRVLDEAVALKLWADTREFRWALDNGTLLKVAITPTILPALLPRLRDQGDARIRLSVGGNVIYVSLPRGQSTPRLELPALTLRGGAPLFPDTKPNQVIESRIKAALDPANRFPTLDESRS